MRILVLAGGYSPERDVSLTSGSLIANALVGEGHDVCLADVYLGVSDFDDVDAMFNKNEKPVHKVTSTVPNLEALKAQSGNGEALIGRGIIQLCRAADVVFLALHGAMGENGQLQATLDNYGIKYTGSGYVGSLLAMDKDISKKMFVGAGVNTPEWIYYDKPSDCDVNEIEQKIGYPCVVKPCSCGSSVGISIVEDHAGLVSALEFASAYEDKILIEKKIEGRELTVGILDGKVLPIIEIIPTEGFYDYTNKYQAGKTLEICPAQIDESIRDAAAKQTRLAFDALRLSGYSRFDFIVDKDGKPWCLEANTLPGMTPTSLLPQMAAAIGISYGKLCERIVELAFKK
ncbi:MAG: D-alanine--D-alanine ligase [Ruminococcaceae bacterium]|nr:D-alanine--D-alanine ligase [Oscillospiraceae bacterium]